MVRPEIRAVTPIEINSEVVEKPRCSSVTITAAVEPLTMPQISPTTSLHSEDTLLDIFSSRIASRPPFSPWAAIE